MPKPPEVRDNSTPYQHTLMMRTSSAHEEGGERIYSINTTQFIGENGAVTGLETVQVRSENINGRLEFVEIPDTAEIHKANLVCLAMGFVGPESSSLVKELQVELDARGNIARDANWMTNVDGLFVAGDAGRVKALSCGLWPKGDLALQQLIAGYKECLNSLAP